MGTTRIRLISIVAILLVLAGVGVFWLARLATADPDATAFVEPSGSAAVTDSTDPTAPPRLTPPGADGSGPPITTGESTRNPRSKSSSNSSGPRRSTSSKPRNTSPPRPRGAISLGGVTLDNTNPVTMCAAFKNASGAITVKVTDVGLSSSKVELSSDRCADDDNIRAFPADRACRSGVTLAANKGCYVGIAAKSGQPPGRYKTTVSVTVSGRCTTAATAPCDAPELKASPPTPANPVDVKWTTRRSGVCYQVASPDPDPFCV
jgi:hypothetical protein